MSREVVQVEGREKGGGRWEEEGTGKGSGKRRRRIRRAVLAMRAGRDHMKRAPHSRNHWSITRCGNASIAPMEVLEHRLGADADLDFKPHDEGAHEVCGFLQRRNLLRVLGCLRKNRGCTYRAVYH